MRKANNFVLKHFWQSNKKLEGKATTREECM